MFSIMVAKLHSLSNRSARPFVVHFAISLSSVNKVVWQNLETTRKLHNLLSPSDTFYSVRQREKDNIT